ncbi:hypothetical protein PHMEG_00025031 [Phytophthora megakarya]|uniref:Ubiquitin-like protease family profile domain-containing protein n=1 Tax=Phytophthora megakarya TaxID=4795 RepID=A0A225VCN5_9STRA|nr:hypothetical protein PHMEG_00025031 [Phytophthora megakarya]
MTATFEKVIGKLARHKYLNDAVMNMALAFVCNYFSNCYVVDSLSITDENMYVPNQPLVSCKFILVHVHMEALKHWIIQIVEVQMNGEDVSKHKMGVSFYDPLGVTSNLEICQAKWISFTLPLLQQWHERDTDRDKVLNLTARIKIGRNSTTVAVTQASQPLTTPKIGLPSVVAVKMTRPKQADAVCCGVLCIAQAYNYVRGLQTLKNYKALPENDLLQMLLRLLWTLINDLNVSDGNNEDTWLCSRGLPH